MSKKSTTMPEVWKNLTAPDKTVASRAVILTLDNKLIVFTNADEIKKHPEISIQAHWANMEEYLTQTNKQTKLAYHEQFIGEVPKDRDDTEIGYMTWSHFVKNGIPILPNQDSTGQTKRVSTIGTRIYHLLPSPGTVPKTPQAQSCLKIMADVVDKEKQTITEEDLKRAIIARGSELKTRQDPWRIFQYYRPTLIAGKWIKHD